MSLRYSGLMLLGLFALALGLGACSAVSSEEDDSVGTIRIQIEGTIKSESDGQPVPDVTVQLLRVSGLESFTVLHTTSTDTEGKYRIEREITDPEDYWLGCGLRLHVGKQGYHVSSRSSTSVLCEEGPQVRNVVLVSAG